jgi:hypothetical protein
VQHGRAADPVIRPDRQPPALMSDHEESHTTVPADFPF